MRNEKTKAQRITDLICQIYDIAHETTDYDESAEILDELGWAVGELSAIGNGLGDKLGIDFNECIR